MKSFKFGKKLMLYWFVLFIIGNTYFGWNLKPESEVERVFDVVVQIMFVAGVFFYFSPLLVFLEELFTNHKKTKDV